MDNPDVTPATNEPEQPATHLRVVVADDNALLREGIASLLEEAAHEVVGRAVDADDLLLKVRSYKPDVAIVDVRMPPRNLDDGLVAAIEIRRSHPSVGVLVLWKKRPGGPSPNQLSSLHQAAGVLRLCWPDTDSDG